MIISMPGEKHVKHQKETRSPEKPLYKYLAEAIYKAHGAIVYKQKKHLKTYYNIDLIKLPDISNRWGET
ncbi:Uncharacterised protein [uncultured archaeon]|nr:Uncharacterised protein [uncultured archaeon]